MQFARISNSEILKSVPFRPGLSSASGPLAYLAAFRDVTNNRSCFTLNTPRYTLNTLDAEIRPYLAFISISIIASTRPARAIERRRAYAIPRELFINIMQRAALTCSCRGMFPLARERRNHTETPINRRECEPWISRRRAVDSPSGYRFPCRALGIPKSSVPG